LVQTGIGTLIGDCAETCPPGTSPLNKICIVCHPSCYSCTAENDSGTCTSCSDTDHVLTMSSTCESQCEELDQFADSSKECQQCHSDCETCFGPLNSECLKCGSLKPLHDASSKLCVASCSSVQYEQDGKCFPCDQTCGECDGPSIKDCTICSVGDNLRLDGSCHSDCGDGEFVFTTGICAECALNCKTCSGPNADQCSECFP
jgi:proprotein convertase subtilisin/kexin type 5